MAYYLVDYENVNNAGLVGIRALTEADHVIIFYTKNAASMSFDTHCALNDSKAKIDYLKVESGTSNALDFQLSSFLGYLIHEQPDDHFYIIAKDQGYKAVVDFWSGADKHVALVANLEKTTLEEEMKEIRAAISGVVKDRKEQDLVVSYVKKYKTKIGLNNALQKQFDSKQGGEIYKCLKPFIKDLKGN